ncbi:MBL fold metallo-hydrolase RNA specificity domain-containing protein [Chromatocurvus halotolerans]|uniref:Metallo-beta-lactamase family protein n=1 Tax=Chromatocurvus halotolerans TaxID=1132028 RepID=A0A4R2KRQ4_9GAMM|nr:MBL fold metallo-hydrolase [Chromatocurvus halotolerans]TCO75452.1 metallo-beta-lactamase family protein [Chromatocurvus halotolerans]
MPTVTCFGAAREVTGSCHLLEAAGVGRFLLDCGMHQGGDAVERVQDETFAFDPASLDAVILSHAHLDHSGLLPRLLHEGFTGPLLCTEATAELLVIMLKDAAGLYLRDLERANLRNRRRGRGEIAPRYTMEDVDAVIRSCQGYAYHQSVALADGASLVFHDAGHILGSAIIEIRCVEAGEPRTLVYSGDLGKTDSVLMRRPATLQHADLVMMESTYGDREHRTEIDTLAEFRGILHDTWARGGNVMIPAFAVGRTQEILFHLGCLYHAGELDDWQVFLDSPMAIAVTETYNNWLRLLDDTDRKALEAADRASLETFLPTLRLTPDTEQSMAINRIKSGAIIIAGSGMCTGGRIRHHIKQRIWDERNTLIFAGFQARGTLGRLLVDGIRKIRLFQDEFVVKAQIETLGGLSAHAGQSELVAWLSAFEGRPATVLVHGEASAQIALAERLQTELGIEAGIPERGEVITF